MSENNIFFGTAFPQRTERDKRAGTSDSGQFIPVWKQEARDEQGRRRFHGAFTGGFSAGYYNTVGSKEGWTPSKFVSSRSSRHEQRAATVEDFMDEEDLQELASTKELVAKDEFDVLGGTEKDLETKRQQLDDDTRRRGDMALLTSSLMNLVAPTQDSIGTRLLQKMGWRPGQGVGPRTVLMDDDNGENSDTITSFQQQTTLAPKDTPIFDYQAKTNVYGLGYNLMKDVPEVAEMRRFQQQQQDQLDQKSGGTKFGIGIFDTQDDDNVMLYDGDPISSQKYHHTLYDTSESNTETLILVNRKKRKASLSVQQTKKKVRCSDGHLPLRGFRLSDQPQELGRWYPPPKVPVDFLETRAQGSTKTVKKQVEITTDARGAMLGEAPIEARSVFDYLSTKSKERLVQATARKIAPPIVDKTRLQVTLVPKDAAKLALQGFIPFGDTPEKQARYRHFLEASLKTLDQQNDPTNLATTFDIPAGMTYESGMKELDEFSKAARIFRPISSMMSGRFTSSSSLSTGSTSSGTVEHVSFEGGLKTEEQWKKDKEIREKQIVDEPKPKLSQEAEAAAMNMFGTLTRTQVPFYPNRLLCKRFNVRNPHPEHVQQGPGHRTQAGSTSALNEKIMASMVTSSSSTSTSPSTLMETQEDDPTLGAIIAKPSSRSNSDKDTSMLQEDTNLTKSDDQDINDEDLNYERPTMDIFKAIFETINTESVEMEHVTSPSPPPGSHSKNNSPLAQAEIADDDIIIGPPAPVPSPRPASSPSETTFFRPMFTKRESLNTKMPPEQVVVTPFQSRLSASNKNRTQRRRVSLQSEPETSSENSDTDKGEKKRRQQRKSSTSKKGSKKHKSSDGRRKHRSHDKHSKERHHHKQSRERGRDEKQPSGSDQIDDMAMWVEKKPSTRRTRAEDLW